MRRSSNAVLDMGMLYLVVYACSGCFLASNVSLLIYSVSVTLLDRDVSKVKTNASLFYVVLVLQRRYMDDDEKMRLERCRD